jgi:hypothetical protein
MGAERERIDGKAEERGCGMGTIKVIEPELGDAKSRFQVEESGIGV